MSITLEEPRPGCSEAELDDLDSAAGVRWPDDVKAFLRASNGGPAAANEFEVRAGLGGMITSFYSASEILDSARRLSDRLAKGSWPIAITESGNLIVLRWSDTWSVCFWDHETEELIEFARSFSDFSSAVRPPTSVKLSPGQVKSVTVSSDFHNKFAKFMKKS